MATAIKRIIREERRRRGEPVGEMEARAGARLSGCSRFGEEDRLTLRDFARAKRPAV